MSIWRGFLIFHNCAYSSYSWIVFFPVYWFWRYLWSSGRLNFSFVGCLDILCTLHDCEKGSKYARYTHTFLLLKIILLCNFSYCFTFPNSHVDYTFNLWISCSWDLRVKIMWCKKGMWCYLGLTSDRKWKIDWSWSACGMRKSCIKTLFLPIFSRGIFLLLLIYCHHSFTKSYMYHTYISHDNIYWFYLLY